MEKKKSNTRFEELSHKHWYDIAENDPDIKHWNIVDESGKKIGEVKDLLFDPEVKKARYLITNLKDGMLEKHSRVLVPIGRARLDKTDKRIILPAVSLSQLARLPEYTGPDNLSSEDEQVIREVFSGSKRGSTEPGNETFYDDEDFQEDRYLGKQ